MIRAVIFDMFETLVTHYNSPLYFGAEMAKDAGIPKEDFYVLWRGLDSERTLGKLTLEELLEQILRENGCYSKELLEELVEKRVATKVECFQQLKVIRESEIFPYFDAAYLSYEQSVAKPDKEIYRRCMAELGVKPEECLYVGDGGSRELETARELGMHAMQAVWYLKKGSTQPVWRKEEFTQLETPLAVMEYLNRYM